MRERSEDDLLKEWKLEANAPASFNGTVWRRIEERQSNSLGTILKSWFNDVFVRPSVALSYATLAMMVGLGVGYMHASRDIQEQESQLQARYIRSVDPYSMPRPGL